MYSWERTKAGAYLDKHVLVGEDEGVDSKVAQVAIKAIGSLIRCNTPLQLRHSVWKIGL